MSVDRLALLADARLPGDTRIIGLYILELGEGWHEVSHEQLRAVLAGGQSDETVRRHLRRLESAGWIEARKNTGRRPPKYRIREAHETPGGRLREALAGSLPHTCEGERDVSPTHTRGRENNPTPVRGKESLAPHTRGAEGPLPHIHEGHRGGRRGGQQLYTPREGDAAGAAGSAGAPGAGPVPEFDLHPRAEEVLAERADDLNGCRGALRDYLRTRVPTDRQYGYVRSVISWLDGMDASVFRLPSGSRAPPEDARKMLRVGLNELLGGAEEQMKRPLGDPGNLKTKISILCKQREDHVRSRNGRAREGDGADGGRRANPISGDREKRRRARHA